MKKTIEIEYDWFKLGTKVRFKNSGSKVVFEVIGCTKPEKNSGDTFCILKGDYPLYITKDLEEVPQDKPNEDKLKPCPFCGSKDLNIRYDSDSDIRIKVICQDCGSQSGSDETEMKMREAWNRRVNES